MKQHPLKMERVLRGWSQAKVAEALNTTVRTVSRWEQGQALPYPFYREQLCQLFGKDARQLGLLPESEEEEVSHAPQEPPASQLPALTPLPTPSGVMDPIVPEALGHANGLLGRRDVWQKIHQQLLEKRCLALYGLPGIGKTALTVTLATNPQAQTHFRDGVLWAGLGPQPDILALLIRWSKLLGITPNEIENASNPEDWGRALRATIGQRRMLLVIDDAWNIHDALALQVGGPQCAHLLTTRQPQLAFAFAQEQAIALHELSEEDSLALIARFVPQLVQQELEEARVLVREVSGLPLALTLMGKYLAAHCLSGQPQRIRRALTQLHQAIQGIQNATPDRSTSPLSLDVPFSLHAAIAISDQCLSSHAHEALSALSVFPAKPDSFTEEAALAVSEEPVEILDELWDAGLLESSSPGRYCLHQTIVNYAQRQVTDTAAQRRLVLYILAYIDEHQQDYETLEREAHILWTAMDTASRLEMWQELVRGAVALVPFMYVRGLYSQADQLLQQALHAALQLEDQLASTVVLYHLADFSYLLGDYSHVAIYGQQGLEIAKRLDQQDLESGFLSLLGNVWRRRGDYAQAKSLLEDGLVLARQSNDQERLCRLLNGLGTVLRHQGDYTLSGAYFAEALSLARQMESQELVSRQLASLSVLEQEQGHYAQAEAYSKEGIQLAWQVGYQEQLCFHLNTLGLIAVEHKIYTQAEAYYLEALAQARRIGHRAHICMFLTNLGKLSKLRGDYTQAERYLQEGVELAKQMGLRHPLATLLLHLGYVIGQQEAGYYRANTCFQECFELVQQLGEPRLIHTMYLFWGEIHLKYRHLEAATSAFDEVLKSISDTGQESSLKAQALYGMARIAELRGAIT
jgi:tetratricopeptide (TPR) repeat protein/transcriptional regulator with XRE-family HTH domain